MASITERKRANAPSKWEAVIRIEGHTTRQLFDSKSDAEKFVEKTEPAMRKLNVNKKAKLEKMRKKEPRLADFYARKLRDVIIEFGASSADGDSNSTRPATKPSHHEKKKPPSQHGRDIGNHRGTFNTVLKHVGDIKVGEAKRSWVTAYIERMRAVKHGHGTGYAYSSIAKQLGLMVAACEYVAAKSDIEDVKLYFHRYTFPKKSHAGRSRRLEKWEDEAIREVLRKGQSVHGQHWMLLYQLALETGARLQELVLAEWQELKRGDAVWVIPEEHTKKKTTRIVSLTPEARSIAARLRALQGPSQYIFHSFGTVKSVGQGFAYRVKKAGVANLRFHDLRHEAISRLVQHPSKPSMHSIMSMVGHKTYEMLLNYTHMREEEFVGLFG